MILHCARDAEENAFDACSMQWKAIQVQCVKTCFHVVPRYPCRCIWMCARMCVGVLFSFSLFVVFFLLFIYLGWCCTVISHIQPTQIHMHIFIELEPIQLNLCYVENNCLLPMVFFYSFQFHEFHTAKKSQQNYAVNAYLWNKAPINSNNWNTRRRMHGKKRERGGTEGKEKNTKYCTAHSPPRFLLPLRLRWAFHCVLCRSSAIETTEIENSLLA